MGYETHIFTTHNHGGNKRIYKSRTTNTSSKLDSVICIYIYIFESEYVPWTIRPGNSQDAKDQFWEYENNEHKKLVGLNPFGAEHASCIHNNLGVQRDSLIFSIKS